MFQALKALFQAAQTLFMSADTLARAFNEVATWSEEEAKGFNEKARLQRNQQLNVIRAQYKVENIKLDHEVDQTARSLGATAAAE